MFSGHTVPPDSKETELGSRDQEASPSAGKNTMVVLVPCSHMEVRPCSYFRWCGYFWGHWVSFVTTDEFSVRVTKITFRIGVSWTHSLPLFLTNLNLTNYDHIIKSMYINQIIFNRTTLWSLALRIIEAFVRILLIVNLSLNQTHLTFLLCVRQTWMTRLILAISLPEVIFL